MVFAGKLSDIDFQPGIKSNSDPVEESITHIRNIGSCLRLDMK